MRLGRFLRGFGKDKSKRVSATGHSLFIDGQTFRIWMRMFCWRFGRFFLKRHLMLRIGNASHLTSLNLGFVSRHRRDATLFTPQRLDRISQSRFDGLETHC